MLLSLRPSLSILVYYIAWWVFLSCLCRFASIIAWYRLTRSPLVYHTIHSLIVSYRPLYSRTLSALISISPCRSDLVLTARIVSTITISSLTAHPLLFDPVPNRLYNDLSHSLLVSHIPLHPSIPSSSHLMYRSLDPSISLTYVIFTYLI